MTQRGVDTQSTCVWLSIYNSYVCVCVFLSLCLCLSLCLSVYPRLLCGLSSSIVLIEAKGSALSPQRFRSPYTAAAPVAQLAALLTALLFDCAGQSATGRQKYVNAEGACVSGLSSVLTDLTITTGNNNNKNNNSMSRENNNNNNNINFGGTGNGSREVAQAQSRALNAC